MNRARGAEQLQGLGYNETQYWRGLMASFWTNLDMSSYGDFMAAIKVSSKVDEKVWSDLRSMARESHQSVSGLLTEAIREYLQRRRVRPVVTEHLEDSIADNRRLGELLAK